MTEKGSHLDIRLPCITSAMAVSKERSNSKSLKRHNDFLTSVCDGSPESGIKTSFLKIHYNITFYSHKS